MPSLDNALHGFLSRHCSAEILCWRRRYTGTFVRTYVVCIICNVHAETPVPPFPFTLNQSPKEIAGSDITNCLTHTMYTIAFKGAWQVMQTLEVWADTKSCRDMSFILLPLLTDCVSAVCMHKIFYCPVSHSYQIHVQQKCWYYCYNI